MTRIGLYLVEDHDIVRQGLRALLDAEPDMCVIGESPDATALAAAVADSDVNVVLMDVSLPGVSATEATAEIRRTLPHVKVLALTRHKEEFHLKEMMRAGASGYVLKQHGIGILLDAIHTVAEGRIFVDPEMVGAWPEPVPVLATGEETEE
jgi:DNA-binding NarL/FixJ family response regulator